MFVPSVFFAFFGHRIVGLSDASVVLRVGFIVVIELDSIAVVARRLFAVGVDI
jgi:hypothetical protein